MLFWVSLANPIFRSQTVVLSAISDALWICSHATTPEEDSEEEYSEEAKSLLRSWYSDEEFVHDDIKLV